MDDDREQGLWNTTTSLLWTVSQGTNIDMRRVGSVLGDLTLPEFKLREKQIQGVIS